jgi:hypothetical protein
MWVSTTKIHFRSVIPKLGYSYPQEYEPGHLVVREKKIIMAGKGTYVNSVIRDKSQSLKQEQLL